LGYEGILEYKWQSSTTSSSSSGFTSIIHNEETYDPGTIYTKGKWDEMESSEEVSSCLE